LTATVGRKKENKRGGIRNMLTDMHGQTPKSNLGEENRSILKPEIVEEWPNLTAT
jgi:hypothetical protein